MGEPKRPRDASSRDGGCPMKRPMRKDASTFTVRTPSGSGVWGRTKPDQADPVEVIGARRDGACRATCRTAVMAVAWSGVIWESMGG